MAQSISPEYRNVDLRFDGPVPEDKGWPMKLKIAMIAVVLSSVSMVAAWGGAWVYFQIHPATNNDYGPISYIVPVSVINADGDVPRVADNSLPAPSFAGPQAIPISLVRTVDCEAYDCPKGGIEVSVNVRFVQLDTRGAAQKVYTVFEDETFNFEEDADYVLNAVKTRTFNRENFVFPEQAVRDLISNNEEVSAWRIEGTTTPVRSDAVPAAWSTQVFHIRVDLQGD